MCIRDRHKGVGSRLYNLLDTFNLTGRILDNNSEITPDKPINYSIVNKLLDIERKKSLDYILSLIHILFMCLEIYVTIVDNVNKYNIIV